MAGRVRERDGKGLRKGKGAAGEGKRSSQSAERQQQSGEGKVRLVLGMPRVSDQRQCPLWLLGEEWTAGRSGQVWGHRSLRRI